MSAVSKIKSKPTKRGARMGSESHEIKSLELLNNLQQIVSDEGVQQEVKFLRDTKSGIDNCEMKVIKMNLAPSVLSTIQGMFQPNKTYRFRLTRTASITTSGAGGLDLQTPIYPSQFDQYAALALLFKQARLRRTMITWYPIARLAQVGSTTYANAPVLMACAFDQSGIGASSPYIYPSVVRLYGSASIPSNKRTPTSLEYVARSTRPWSIMASTATGTDPQGGVIGAWCYSLFSPGDVSTSYFSYTITADYEFSNSI